MKSIFTAKKRFVVYVEGAYYIILMQSWFKCKVWGEGGNLQLHILRIKMMKSIFTA